MSLVFTRDLDAWRSWQADQHRLRTIKGQLVSTIRAPQAQWFLASNHDEPRVVVSMDTTNPTAVGSLIAPLHHVVDLPVAVVAPVPLDTVAADLGLRVTPLNAGKVDGLVEGSRCVMTAGQYLPVGVATQRAAHRYGRPVLMVQHGALTPYAPPLPADSTLLAWSDADGEFWRSGRDDVRFETVGSQLLWEAAGQGVTRSDGESPRLTYLGQGHAAELPRTRLVQAALQFCRVNGATYRPHPSERDKVSRLTHGAFRRAGIDVDSSIPLSQLVGPVVSVFSTGVLEAAAQGREAWVDFPDPPTWLSEFWERYGMSRFGGESTAPPFRSTAAPAERIARIIEEVAA